jgi:hypothetical protein
LSLRSLYFLSNTIASRILGQWRSHRQTPASSPPLSERKTSRHRQRRNQNRPAERRTGIATLEGMPRDQIADNSRRSVRSTKGSWPGVPPARALRKDNADAGPQR